MIYLDAFKRPGLLYAAVERDGFPYGFEQSRRWSGNLDRLRALVAGVKVVCFDEAAQIMADLGIKVTAIRQGPQPAFPADLRPDDLPYYVKTRNIGLLKDWRMVLL